MITAIKLRGDTTERWALNNPVLLLRETVLDTTLNKFKIGDGARHYLDLPYAYPGGTSPEADYYKSNTIQIDTGDFIPVNPQISGAGYEYQITPGSYGVIFTNAPIEGLSDVNFNLKVDYVSHDGSGGDGNQDILQTLTTKDGVSYTRRLYHVGQQADMSATDFKMVGSGGASTAGLVERVEIGYIQEETPPVPNHISITWYKPSDLAFYFKVGSAWGSPSDGLSGVLYTNADINYMWNQDVGLVRVGGSFSDSQFPPLPIEGASWFSDGIQYKYTSGTWVEL